MIPSNFGVCIVKKCFYLIPVNAFCERIHQLAKDHIGN